MSQDPAAGDPGGSPYSPEYSSASPGFAPPGHEERMWAMLAHLAALLGYVIPFGNLIGPLIVWMIKKDSMPFVDDQAKESLNFQITIVILAAVVVALFCTPIGIVLAPVLVVYSAVMIILGAVKANNGVVYRYPLTLRLIT